MNRHLAEEDDPQLGPEVYFHWLLTQRSDSQSIRSSTEALDGPAP